MAGLLEKDDHENGDRLAHTGAKSHPLSEFREYIRQNLAELERESWDEAAYRWFYRDSNGPLWDRLRPELNWKPYWGWNPQARIIHFHGPKPYQRSCLDSVFPEPKYLTSGSYYELCEQWSELLAAASIH